MRPSWFLWFSVWAQLVPALALALTRQRTRASTLLALGALIGLLSDLIGRILVLIQANNQIATHLSSPISAACYLAALAEWQTTATSRRTFRWGIVAFALIWLMLLWSVEDLRNFGKFDTPLYALTLLAGGLWTVLRRAQVFIETPLHRMEWFWGGVGLALQGAAMTLAASVGAILVARERLDLFDLVWHVRAATIVLSYSLLAVGVAQSGVVSKFSTIGQSEP